MIDPWVIVEGVTVLATRIILAVRAGDVAADADGIALDALSLALAVHPTERVRALLTEEAIRRANIEADLAAEGKFGRSE